MGYPSDLNDKQWNLIKHHFDCGKYGNRRLHNRKELVNEVFFYIKSGCQWRMLPKDFPPYSTVHTFYRRCRIKGIWEKIMDNLVEKSRVKIGRNEKPSYSIIDSQSINLNKSNIKK